MAQSKNAQRIGITIIALVWLLAVWFLITPILICTGLVSIAPPVQYRKTIDNPGAEFTQITKLEWPKSAKVITVSDTHGGFLGDGEFYLVFETEQEDLEKWLSNPPPWEIDEWVSGPVPPEIGSNASFGLGGAGTSSINGVSTEYWGGEPLIQLLNSNNIWYVAKERCCGRDSLYFHNGELLIIDLEAGKVWLSSWDY